MEDARPAEMRITSFVVSPDLDTSWTRYIEKNDEQAFWVYIRGLVSAWEQQVAPNWEMVVSGALQGREEQGPRLEDLPDELLVASSKFLFVLRDEAEQGEAATATVASAVDLIKCLTVLCRRENNIPLVASMDLVQLVTQIDSLLLERLLEVESTFFKAPSKTQAKAADKAKKKLRSAIMGFVTQSCHLLESIYDPYLRWRTFLSGGDSDDQRPPTPVALHQETVPFLYVNFETALAESFPQLAEELLTVFGAVLCGARHNAARAISPATTKMLLKTVRDRRTSDGVHVAAIYCSAKSIQLLHEMPLEERQIDIGLLIEQYEQILMSLASKEDPSLATLVEGVAMLTRLLKAQDRSGLQLLLTKYSMIETLLKVSQDARLDPPSKKKSLLPVVIERLSLLMRDCDIAAQRMAKVNGYKELFAAVEELGPPDANTLNAILAMATHGESISHLDKERLRGVVVRNVDPILCLLRWMRETEFEIDTEKQSWLAERIFTLCSANIRNKMLCCQSGMLLELTRCLNSYQRLGTRTAIELVRLIEALGTHSISPYELKQFIMLLHLRGDQSEDVKFPYKSHIIHVISSMSKSDGYESCSRYFDIGPGVEGLSVPGIRHWPGPVCGFTFHCWLRLDKMPTTENNQRRRMLYSLYTSSGNGFEAFVTEGGVLVAAVAHKKEYLAVPLEGFPLADERWHCVAICHSAGKRPFGASSLCLFIDGAKRLECSLKYPVPAGEAISYCQIGSTLHRGRVPALAAIESEGFKHHHSSFKEGLIDAIKVSLPGVINLPSTLRPGGGHNDPHVKWTLIGLEDDLWGRQASLCGQLGMICCFQDALTLTQVKLMQSLGPNRWLNFAEDSSDAIDLLNRAVFAYSARAAHNRTCPNLLDPSHFEAHVYAEAFSTQNVKDVVNCIGGVQALFPLLETATAEDVSAADTGYLSLRGAEDESGSFSRRQSVEEAAADEWEMLPSSSFSDWKLEQNPISGFLTLVKNLVTGHTVNMEQLMRGGGVAVIGSLLQSAAPKAIDVNVLMAAQLLVELAQSAGDQKLRAQIYQSILFDFRIWSRSEFHVQIGHVQYISTVIKDDRRFFRRKFGVQFLLDVMRRFYRPGEGPQQNYLTPEDRRTVRSALFSLVKYFLQHKDVTSTDVHPLVAFMLSEKSEQLVREASEMIAHYLSNKQARDQVFLALYESRRMDLVYCLLLSKEFSPSLKRSLLRLLTVLLRTNRVSLRHKYRMHLAEVRYLGFLHFWFSQPAFGGASEKEASSQPVTKEEILLLLDQMLLFDQPVSYQGILGLIHHLQWSPTSTKLEVARRIMTCLFAKPDVPTNFARQIGWQECLTRLLVKKTVKSPSDEVAFKNNDDNEFVMLSPTHAHYLELATSTAKQYLPAPAGDAVELLGSVVSSRVASNVSQAVQATSEAVQSRTQQILDKMQSGLDGLHERANSISSSYSRRSRRGSASSICDEMPTTTRLNPPPQYLSAFDHFGFEDIGVELAAPTKDKSNSSSSEDVSISRADTNSASTPTRTKTEEDGSGSNSVNAVISDIEEVSATDASLAHHSVLPCQPNSEEEELCQLVVSILFTVMWRGVKISGVGDETAAKERGQVIACINMLGLNNELYRSHVELKRMLVEQCVQALLADLNDADVGIALAAALAEHVLQWVYDLVVLDPYGDFDRKVSEPLLDGVLAVLERLLVFQDGVQLQQQEEWESMGKMALEVLLKCAEDAGDVDVRAIATAKLHTLVQTRSSSSASENGYLILRLSKIIAKQEDDKDERFSYVAPVVKALLEKSREQLHITTQLPSLNLRQTSLPEKFYSELRHYICSADEWRYFATKRLEPLAATHRSGLLIDLARQMDVFWAECYECAKTAEHRRAREMGESRLRFESRYAEPFSLAVRQESTRYHNILCQQRSHLTFIRRRWEASKRLFFSPRGAWHSDDASGDNDDEHWQLTPNENRLRMRLKLIPNPEFDSHSNASASRDNIKPEERKKSLLELQISKEALRGNKDDDDDSLSEEDLKNIAREKMETTDEISHYEKSSERLLLSEDCELVTLMAAVKGKFELTNRFAYFFDGSPFEEEMKRADCRFSLAQLRTVQLRRFNLRRSALEFFLADRTCYLINFASNRRRNRVYARVVGLRLPGLVTFSHRTSPAEMLKASGHTQRWVAREITNFEYLMHLNTLAGRSFNDLSQYPVFPWVLKDYESKTLDLERPETFRDLSKPVGVQNPKHAEEVQAKYEAFEDPTGVVSKFHYGTHYSNSAMVLHYLVRVEPFTSLHIELQSGRFDVADRQFHSVAQTWRSLYRNLNDVKELIPEFYYFPEFLLNQNGFDLGRLQGKDRKKVGNVELPPWAQGADDFIRKHRQALECEYVSANLHRWIDLVFGHKQKGAAAVEALNVFYYCSYEGAVDLDAIKDPAEREAVEGMINNFGQTPCQLLKEPHPPRIDRQEFLVQRQARNWRGTDILVFPEIWTVSRIANEDPRDAFVLARSVGANSSSILTVSAATLTIGVHACNTTNFERDPTASASCKARRSLPLPLTPGLKINKNLFEVSADGKTIFSGGHWDNSLQVYSVAKDRTIKVIRHIDVVTCLSLDQSGGEVLITGSRDTTSIIWDVSGISDVGGTAQSGTQAPNPRALQVLSGHDAAVTCVVIASDLDLAASGSEDGTVNVYTAKEGQYLRTLRPNPSAYTVSQLALSPHGHICIAGHTRSAHSLAVFNVNGRPVGGGGLIPLAHRATALLAPGSSQCSELMLLVGDENGDLMARKLLAPSDEAESIAVAAKLALGAPIQDLALAPDNLYLLAPLRDGGLIMVGLSS